MTNGSRHHSHGNHHQKNYTHTPRRTEGSRHERSNDHTPRRTEGSRHERNFERAPLRRAPLRSVQPSGTETAIRFVGTIVKAIFKGSVQAIGEFGEYVAKNQEDYELAQARLRAKKQLIQKQASQYYQPTWIRTSEGTIITVGTSRIKPRCTYEDTRTATERVLGGSFGDKSRKGNKTASEIIFGGRFER